MPYAMKLLRWANGKSLACAGEYVKTVNVQTAHMGFDWLTTTPNITEAHIWPDMEALMKTYYEVLEPIPFRPDGKPNKPMTAINVEPVRVRKKELT